MDKVNAIFNTLVTPRNNSGRSKIVSKLNKLKNSGVMNLVHISAHICQIALIR